MKQAAAIVMLTLITGCGERISVQNSEGAEALPAANNSSQSNSVATAPQPDASPNETKTGITIPDTPVSGTIGQHPFKPDTFLWDNNSLSIQVGDRFIPKNAVQISDFLPNDQPAFGQKLTWNKTDTFTPGKRFPKVKLLSDRLFPPLVLSAYDLALQFGEVNENGQVTGRIFLQTSDKPGVKITGIFSVTAPEVLSQLPQTWHRPWVVTHIELPNRQKHKVKVGYVGLTSAGKWKSNFAGTTLQTGVHSHASSLTYKPQVSTIASAENLGPHGRHTHLSPGTYLFYVTENEHHAKWKVVEVTADTAAELNFTFDPAGTGSLTVKVPNAQDNDSVLLIPLTSTGESPIAGASSGDLRYRLQPIVGAEDVKNGTAQFANLTAGRYRIHLQRLVTTSGKSKKILPGKQTVDVEIQADQESQSQVEFIEEAP